MRIITTTQIHTAVADHELISLKYLEQCLAHPNAPQMYLFYNGVSTKGTGRTIIQHTQSYNF